MNHQENENSLVVKIVYYGPALSGKTTNLISLHDNLQPQLSGELMSLETKDDRTLFFDLLPMGFKTASGLLVKIKLFTVPGQVQHDSTRKAVLSRADGVVFVADSQFDQSINNGESFQNLAENAARVGLDFPNLPLVVQFNKRDLPDTLSREEIRSRWKNAPWPIVYSVAVTGHGVLSTFRQLLAQLYVRLDGQHRLSTKHGMDCPRFIQAIMGDVSFRETDR